MMNCGDFLRNFSSLVAVASIGHLLLRSRPPKKPQVFEVDSTNLPPRCDCGSGEPAVLAVADHETGNLPAVREMLHDPPYVARHLRVHAIVGPPGLDFDDNVPTGSAISAKEVDAPADRRADQLPSAAPVR